MKLRKKIFLSLAATFCGGWCCYMHLHYYHAQIIYYPISKTEYVTSSFSKKKEYISHIYHNCIIPLISTFRKINDKKGADAALSEVTELCSKLYTQDCFIWKGYEVFTHQEIENMLDECIAAEKEILPNFAEENASLIKEIERLEAVDYFGNYYLKHLVKSFIYSDGLLLYIPSATLKFTIDASDSVIDKTIWAERLKRKSNYFIDVMLCGARYRWFNLGESPTSPHNEWCDIYILDPAVGPHHYNNQNYSFNYDSRYHQQINVLSPAQHFNLFMHCCPACQYYQFNLSHSLITPKLLSKEHALESIRITELAQYTAEELKKHPRYITTFDRSLFFKLSPPCKSSYLEIIYRGNNFFGLKYWNKLPKEIQPKMLSSTPDCG